MVPRTYASRYRSVVNQMVHRPVRPPLLPRTYVQFPDSSDSSTLWIFVPAPRPARGAGRSLWHAGRQQGPGSSRVLADRQHARYGGYLRGVHVERDATTCVEHAKLRVTQHTRNTRHALHTLTHTRRPFCSQFTTDSLYTLFTRARLRLRPAAARPAPQTPSTGTPRVGCAPG